MQIFVRICCTILLKGSGADIHKTTGLVCHCCSDFILTVFCEIYAACTLFARMGFFPEMMFNVDDGYLEGLTRGFKAGILTRTDYLNLVQCETIDGKLWLGQVTSVSWITSIAFYRPEAPSAKYGLWKLLGQRTESSPSGRDRRKAERENGARIPTYPKSGRGTPQHLP